MSLAATPQRRLTLRDVSVLVAATAVGLWLARLFLEVEPVLFRGRGPGDWRDWAGASYMVLMTFHLGVFVLSLLPPRPSLRRRSRQPGFLAGIALATLVVLNSAEQLYNFLYNRRAFGGQNPFVYWLHNYLLSISGPFHVVPAIAVAWLVGGLRHFRWRDPDWTEWLGRVLGAFWVVYWIVILILRPYW